jgi:hypothetical protein
MGPQIEGLEGGYKMRIFAMLKSFFLSATAYHLLKYDILKIEFSGIGITMLRF